MRRAHDARYIRPASIRIGDTIRISWKHADVDKSVTGTVGVRAVYTGFVDYETSKNQALITSYADGRTNPPGARVTLLHRNPDPTPTLEGLDL